VVVFFVLRGVFRGFIKEVISIVGLLAAFLLAVQYYQVVGDALKPFIHNEAYRQTIGFEALFIAVFFLFGLIGLLLDMLVKVTFSRAFNSLLGAALAAVKALALCGVVLMGVTTFIHQDTPFFSKSAAWPYFRSFADGLKSMTPADLRAALENQPVMLPENLRETLNIPELEEAPDWKPVAPEEGAPPPPAWPGEEDEEIEEEALQ
jgi:membrane protein required for colicin V production